MTPRRIAAVVLPRLACELVRQKGGAAGPLAVILDREEARARDVATAVLDVVSDEARRYGVRPGQKVPEATALVASLAIHRLPLSAIEAALANVAEVALALGPTAAIRLQSRPVADAIEEGDGPFDTVWLDISGAAHLVGGEEALAAELALRAGALGHLARVAIADGPRLAQALARFPQAGGEAVAPAGQGARALAPLPVQCLPLAAETASFLVRLGVLTVGDLAKLPRAAAAARLGPRAGEVLALVAGFDPTPLVPYVPPRVLVEEASFEEGVHDTTALLFVLRGMASRVSARLEARGEAAGRLEVTIPYDRSVARLLAQGSPAALGGDESAAPAAGFRIDFPAPLSAEGDLLRALKAKLERTVLAAPAVGLRLAADDVTRARKVQIDLSRDEVVSPDALPALLAELSAEIGEDRLGVLSVVDTHRPEARSRLRAVGAPRARELAGALEPGPTRLLPAAVPLGRLGSGAVVAVVGQLYAVESLRFERRLEAVEWWTASPLSRDYFSAWLASSKGDGAGEASIYVERATGEGFLQGWRE